MEDICGSHFSSATWVAEIQLNSLALAASAFDLYFYSQRMRVLPEARREPWNPRSPGAGVKDDCEPSYIWEPNPGPLEEPATL